MDDDNADDDCPTTTNGHFSLQGSSAHNICCHLAVAFSFVQQTIVHLKSDNQDSDHIHANER